MEKVAIVILNWNGVKMMRRFLPGVLRYSIAPVYVADNASTDESLSFLASNFPQVRTIILDRNYGFAEGYNRALSEIEAEYYVLLNSDVEITDEWLSPLLDFMEQHPTVAACQPKILSQQNHAMFEYAGASGGFIDSLGYPYCRGRIFNTLEKDDGQYDTALPVFWATGAAMMVRSSVYREVGGLDGRFFAHMEEIDFCWRLRSRGYGVMCVPSSCVYHVGGGTLPQKNPRKTFLNFRNNLLMLYKNLPDEQLLRVMLLRVLLDFIAALQFLLKGESDSCAAVFKAHYAFYKMRKSFIRSRCENRCKSVLRVIPEQWPQSILWEYYVKREKKYSVLRHK